MDAISLENQYCAQNYAPLPVVLKKGSGIYLWDTEGKRYIDMMSAYSAVSFGHCHEGIVEVLTKQAHILTITSRAYHTDKLGPFLAELCRQSRFDKALPMNTGAEAVETALKAIRKWGYVVKNILKDKAEIIACEGNFHGRTLAIVAMSSEPQYKEGFGPFPKGLKTIPFGDATALEKAITPNTAGFIVEPIQGENGIIIPPEGYLKKCREICDKHNVLLICDEVQTGLGRTGKRFAFEHDNIQPDGLILGKALGGGVFPVSAFLANDHVMQVFTPGDHGSTFGGNPLGSAVAHEALLTLDREHLIEQSATLGKYFLDKLKTLKSPLIKDIRGRGLFVGMEIDPKKAKAKKVCLKLMENGLLTKDTHETVLRFAPPLIITEDQINDAFEIIENVIMNW